MRWIVSALCLLSFAIAFDQSNLANAADSKPLKLLYLGDNGHHQPRARFGQLQPVLKARGIELEYTDVVGDLNAEKLAKFDGLVLFANIDKIEDDQAKALLAYVASGKGFVPLHCASYCFRNNDDVVALMGAQFQRHGTGTFRVVTTEAGKSHPLLKGYKGFESFDETYVHTKHNENDRVVLETRAEGEGQEPWTWVRTHGKGRVFYTAWGHDERTWGNPGFQNLVERGIRWACNDDVSKVPSFSDRLEMTTPRKDVKPFEYVDAVIPFYPPSKQAGVPPEPVKKLQKPLSAEESIKHFITPVGFAVELFAADPAIGKPLAMNWDERGRLWLCETLDYPNELQEPTKGRDRIRICEDTNGDGKADKFTIFAEQLSIPTAITFYRGGAIVQDGTQTVYLKDTNGDDKADIRKVIITGWALGDTHGGVSNFQYGLDNWYYGMQGYNNSKPMFDDGKKTGESFRQGFFRFRLEGENDHAAVKDVEFLRSTNNNTWGLGLSEEGLIFGSTANGNPSEFLPIANRYYEKVRGWSSSVLGGIADRNKIDPFSDKVRQVDWHGGFTAAAGHALYTARAWPKEYWNRTAFVCEPTGKLVSTFVLRPDGAGFRSNNPWNILASDDEWSAPIMAEVGPDGQLWVIDWYNIIVQHNPTPAGYKTGKGNAYEIDLRDKKHGRIYRVVWKGTDDEPAPIPPNPDLSTVEGQLDALKTGNMLWRKHAQRLMVEDRNADVVQQLIATIQDHATDEINQNGEVVHALWTLHGRGATNGKNPDYNKIMASTLEHPSAGVRRNAVMVLPSSASGQAARLLKDKDSQVRLAALLSLADMPKGLANAISVLDAFATGKVGDDRWLRDAAISAAAQQEEFFLETVAQRSNDKAAVPPDVLTIVAEHVARGGPMELRSLLQSLVKADARTTQPILDGFLKGWPKGRRLTLDEMSEASLVELLAKLPPASRGVLVNLASRWGSKALEAHVGEITKGFLAVVTDDKAKESDRIAAAKQLVEFKKLDGDTTASLVKLITPRTSAELANGLVEAIGLSESPTAGDTLIASWPTLTPTVRQTALRGLLARADWTKTLIAAFESGDVQLTDLSLEQKQALANHPDKQLAARVKPLLAKGGGLPNPDRQKVIDELMPTIEKVGEVANGKAVFKKTCAKCHTHSGEGTKIGPDLTGMAVHPKHELIIHILDPSRSVEGNFRIYTVQTDEGKVFNGLLASESKTAIELIDVEAKKHTILRENIDELISSKKSLMPEGVEKLHTPTELRDLLEFLTARGKYLPIPIEKVATIVSTKGMFNSEDANVERLIFPDWKPKIFEGVPFVLVDPQGDKTPNVIMLNGSAGNIPPKMPKSVTLPCNSTAKAIHFLGGISGWGWPASEKGTTCLIVRLKYADGQTEDHALKNGEHFADYIRRVDVPGSKFAFALRGQQARYFAVHPQRSDKIATIELVKGAGRDVTSPVIMAVTVEGPDAHQ
ncbi:MAG: ThuA domain-containing protein [Planctomycetaceae bacterium]|nr:ThuA domain-containing protein [Planctomycetaceae bacterium]